MPRDPAVEGSCVYAFWRGGEGSSTFLGLRVARRLVWCLSLVEEAV